MIFKVNIVNLGGDIISQYDYNENDNKEYKINKLEEALNNNDIKNECLENNKLIVVLNGTKHYYINFIYLEDNKLHFSDYKIFSNDLINDNDQLNIVFINMPILIDNLYTINKCFQYNDYDYLYNHNIDYINNHNYDLIKPYLKNDNSAYFFVNINPCVLEFISHDLINYKEIVLLAVKSNGDLLQYVSNNLKADTEVVLLAVINSVNCALQYASYKLQEDKEIVNEAIKIDIHSLAYASIKLLNYLKFLILNNLVQNNKFF